MITPDDSIPRIKDFCKKYYLWEVDNLEVLLDRGGIFKQTFGKAILPSVYIYQSGKLKKKYLGETKPEAISTIMQL